MSQLTILYQDDDYVAINKPSGLLVHRSDIDRYEKRFALQMLRNHLGQHVFPVHRLDKPTSGVLLFGLSSLAASKMQEIFQARDVKKEYHAIVRGYMEEEGVLDKPLSDIREKFEKAKPDEMREPQVATTRYKTVAKIEVPFANKRYSTSRYSLICAYPETGRKHQIRRHLDQSSHPIIGDTRYGDGVHNRYFRDQIRVRRLLLWSSRLTFTQPLTGKLVDIQAPTPNKVKRVLYEFNWADPAKNATE